MKNAALACMAGTLLLLTGTGAVRPARAQYVNPYTGNNWNNPNSSLLDTVIQGERNRRMLNSILASSGASAAAVRAAYTRQVQSGESRIQSGKATTRFSSGPFPTDYWVLRSGGDTPKKRRQYTGEFDTQRQDLGRRGTRSRHGHGRHGAGTRTGLRPCLGSAIGRHGRKPPTRAGIISRCGCRSDSPTILRQRRGSRRGRRARRSENFPPALSTTRGLPGVFPIMMTIYDCGPEDLIAEHFEGPHFGLLSVAQDFVLRLRLSMGHASDDEIAEAAFAEGLSEIEVAAALMLERGEYVLVRDPRGQEWVEK